MIIDAINRIEQSNTIENIALQNHIVSKGIYIIVDQQLNYKIISRDRFSFNIKYVAMDFYSNIIELNKAVDKYKLITSNNCCTFFCKHIDRLNIDIIDNYYNTLNTPEKCVIYNNWIKENIFNIYKELNTKDNIKFFFVADIEKYINANKSYLNKYILSNAVNTDIEELGTPVTVNLNSKKQFLKNMSRKQEIPYLANKELTIKYMYFNNLLISLAKQGKELLYILENGELISLDYRSGEMANKDFYNGIIMVYEINERGKLSILDMDLVPRYTRNL